MEDQGGLSGIADPLGTAGRDDDDIAWAHVTGWQAFYIHARGSGNHHIAFNGVSQPMPGGGHPDCATLAMTTDNSGSAAELDNSTI